MTTACGEIAERNSFVDEYLLPWWPALSTGQATLSLTIAKATPVITWANPAGITYPAALSATQLNASCGVTGSFAYTPALGTVMNAGASGTLAVQFTPTDTANYNNASANVTINVTKGAPVAASAWAISFS